MANRSLKRGGIVLGVLVAIGAGLLWWLLTHNPKEPGRVVAASDLPALTLLTWGNLDVRGSVESVESRNKLIEPLTDHYLLVGVKEDGEVKPEMVVPKALLEDRIAVAIPATVTASIAGQLHVGDVIDLVAVPKNATQAKPYEGLIVLSIAPAKDGNAITLAVPRAERENFALAVTGNAELVWTRRIAPSQESK